MVWVLITALLVFCGDQWTKRWIADTFMLAESRPVIEGVFHFTYVRNTGAAFGLLTDHTALLAFVSLIVIVAVLWLAARSRQWDVRLAFGAVLGGAVGNAFDRLVAGAVVDFLDFRIWPVFNVADVAIVCGAVWLGLRLLRDPEAVLP